MNASQQKAMKKEPRQVPDAMLLFEIDTSTVRDEAATVLSSFFLDLLKGVLEDLPER